MKPKHRAIAEIVIAVLMMAVLVKILFVTKTPKSYTCRPKQSDGYLICDYQY